MAAYARQHRGSRPFTGHWRKRGAHAEAFGRSRGGFTSKIHARCDNQGRPLGFVLTGGQVSDYKAVNALLELPAPNPRAMLADRGYDSDSFRQDLLIHGILPVGFLTQRPQRSTENMLQTLSGPQSHRADVQQAQADAPHRIPLRQDRRVLHEFPQDRHRKLWIRSFVNVA
uniref:transposase n=1 Tax=Gluconobacter thailandicus TaxID=257438 RepID=UPI0038CFD10B